MEKFRYGSNITNVLQLDIPMYGAVLAGALRYVGNGNERKAILENLWQP